MSAFTANVAHAAPAQQKRSVAVYVSPTSPFPSGQFPREFLESRTIETRAQRWLRVRAANGKVGWVPEDSLITRYNQASFGAFAPRWPLQPMEGIVARASQPLRSSPQPSAEIVATLPRGSSVQRVADTILRWGRARGKSLGHTWKDSEKSVWWPMSESTETGSIAKKSIELRPLSTAEVFKRKIFDLAASPTQPERQLASAKGVFRTVDGRMWERIPEFGELNYPVAYSRSGAAFVGPYVSNDGGKTFEQFVKWDALVDAIKTAFEVDPDRMKILETKPLDASGTRVRLNLEIGAGQIAVATTEDFGSTWTVKRPIR